ncbi:casein kinase 1-like protein HD16 [Lolium rigidum]|uniref:casein kinase 1-like protein HD16 n=1 Tax=Lolium rigidum TaxID=89674 RepID=UPI001F5DDC11|nr:casein kinase 1-like protein HD16 [Lolium rigidum]
MTPYAVTVRYSFPSSSSTTSEAAGHVIPLFCPRSAACCSLLCSLHHAAAPAPSLLRLRQCRHPTAHHPAAISLPPGLLLHHFTSPLINPSLPTRCALMEAAAILFSMRHPGAVPPGEVPARPDIDLNRAANDDEGGGGGAADHSTRDGGATAADGFAPAAHADSATKLLPETVLHNQNGNADSRGSAGIRGGSAEGRASKPRGKGFGRVTDGAQTYQIQSGNASPRGRAGGRGGAAKGTGRPPSKPRGKGFRVPVGVQADLPQPDLPGEAAGAGRVQQDHGLNKERESEAMIRPLPERVEVGDSPIYVTGRKLGNGSSCKVYVGRRLGMPTGGYKGLNAMEVALKFEHRRNQAGSCDPPLEWQAYQTLNGCYGIPPVYYKGRQGDYYILIMAMLGPTLWDVWYSQGQKMSFQMVACIAVEAISILAKIHSKGLVHGNVKPDNFLFGQRGSAHEKKLFLTSFGSASNWKCKRGSSSVHVQYDQRPDIFRGTIRYASVHAHLGHTSSRRDDLESLAYTLILLLRGRLPWEDCQGDNQSFLVCKKKMETSPEMLSSSCPAPFKHFLEMVTTMKFDEEPKYRQLVSLFDDLIEGPASLRPIRIDGALQGGHKRGRMDVNLEENEQSIKKVRLGSPATQWISVYNARWPIKQRYHCNVADSRMHQHIQKGNEDGLFISCVASSANLWAVVMDAGTGFANQVIKLSQKFLDKDWIMEKWDNNFYITAIAGAANGSSLVVMSKGTPYTQQGYKVSEHFPYKWINKRWKEGFHVTCMGTAGNRWGVVMSRNTCYSDQVVELDFQYPSEGLHQRYGAGYRITSCAATPDQAAFIMSITKKSKTKPMDETLLTSDFPSKHIKEQWEKNMYIAAICHGRTTC